MMTSYYRRYAGPGAVPISRTVPPWWKPATKHRRFHALLPPAWLLRAYMGRSKVARMAYEPVYRAEYRSEILSNLDPFSLWDELNVLTAPHEPVLMCWERAGEFCHRRIVAEWLERSIGVEIPELEEAPKTAADCGQLVLFGWE